MKTNRFYIATLPAILWGISTQCVLGENPLEWNSLYWGAATNGVKTGVYVQHLSGATDPIPIRCTPYLLNSRTNRLWLYFPPPESCYQLTLRDEKGNPVTKTKKGKGLGKPITKPLLVKIGGLNVSAGYAKRGLIPNNPEQFIGFDLRDYFAITNSGKYRLTIEVRVVWPQARHEHDPNLYTTNVPMVSLPPVEAEIDILPWKAVSHSQGQ